MKRIMVIIGAVAALALCACDFKESTFKTQEQPRKWEYGFQFAKDSGAETVLDALGKRGWEAVWCRRARGGTDSDPTWGYECLFKRPVKE